MEPLINPFRPGAGVQPPELVGRQAEIDYVDLMVAKSRKPRNDGGLVLFGLRGVGKTVLLNRLQQNVERAGWVTVYIEARPGKVGQAASRAALGRNIGMASRKVQRFHQGGRDVKHALSSLSSFSATVAGSGFSVGIAPAKDRANSGSIEVDLSELVEDLAPALIRNQSAFAVFVDEMQDLDSELLTALLAAQHRASQQDWPFYIIGAGLPTVRRSLTDARSYAERLKVTEIGPLAPSVAMEAIVKPAGDLGVTFTEDAASRLVVESNGYPFFLQTYGKATWDAAPDRYVDIVVAEAGIAEGNADLDQSFFPARWDRTTPSERQYLRAIVAVGGGAASTADVAEHLGVKTSALSPVRQSLIEKGIVFAERRGFVSFTVPNMESFILRQDEE